MSYRAMLWTSVAVIAFYGMFGCAHAADDANKVRPTQGETTKAYETYKDHTDEVLSVAINPLNPNEFITGGRDKSPERDRPLMRVWDFTAGKQAYAINYLYGDPLVMSYSSDGRYLLVVQDNYWDKEQGVIRYVARLTIYDARRGRVIKNVDRGEFNAPIGSSFAPDGKSFAFAGMGVKNIEIWGMDLDVDKIYNKKPLIGHLSWVTSTAWSPDSSHLASASMDGTVRVWDVNKAGDPVVHNLAGHTHSVNAVAWSADGLLIASGSSDKTVRLWDPNSGVLKQTCLGHTEAVTSVVITPDSKLVFSASMDKTIRVWDPSNGACLQVLTGHTGPVYALAVSSDGKILISGSQDKTVISWTIGKYTKAVRR